MSVHLAGSFTRARARRVQAILLGYFAYCLVSAVVLWTVVAGTLATPMWLVCTVGPVLAYTTRRSIADLVKPVVDEHSGRDDVVRELGPLVDRSYIVRHDADLGRGTVHHLVVGPSGIYAIERSARRGRFALKGAKLVCAGVSAQRLTDRATNAADLVSRRLALAGVDASVTPVLALTRAERTSGTIALRRVSVVHADDLAAWINRRPVTLETLAIERARDALS